MPAKGRVPPHLRKYLFKKGHGKMPKTKHRKKSKSTALVRYTAPTVVRYKTRHVKVQAKRRSGTSGSSLMKREHGAGSLIPGPFRVKSMGFSSLIGYSEAGKGFAALQEFMVKLPSLGKLPKEAVAGAVLNYFADRSEWLDAAAQAFLDIGAYKVGQSGYSVSGDGDDD